MKTEQATTARGRPREFDRAASLQKALTLFWSRGYEGTSIADLVAAMGIAPPSLYAAFGSKNALYRETIALYLKGPGQFVARALDEETSAKDAMERILRDAARTFPAKNHPPGCMVSIGSLTCAPDHRKIAADIADIRAATTDAIKKRIKQAQKDGEMAQSIKASDLARFYGTIIQGMSVQARDGATSTELMAIATLALAAWPKKPKKNHKPRNYPV